MSAGNFPKFIRPLDAGEHHEIFQCISIGAPSLRIIDIGEPFDHQRNISEAMEVGRRQKPAEDKSRLEGGIDTGKSDELMHPFYY